MLSWILWFGGVVLAWGRVGWGGVVWGGVWLGLG